MNSHFDLDCIQSHAAIPAASEAHLLYVLAHVQLRGKPLPASLNPVQIVLVIDRSHSMAGERIAHVRAAISKLAQRLQPADQLAVISFNDRATLVSGLQAVGDRRALERALGTIEAAGGTEIASGLALAAAELRRACGVATTRRIFLLTDGHTYGDEKECLSLARRLQGQGVGIAAVGLGDDWNEALLQAIGAGPNSRALYLPSVDRVAALMETELQHARAAIVPDLTLQIAVGPGVRLRSIDRVEPFVAPLSPVAVGEAQHASLLDGWTPTERHGVLLELVAPRLRHGIHQIAQLWLSHGRAGVPLDQPAPPAAVSVAVEPGGQPGLPDKRVVAQLERLTAYRLQEAAWRELATGNAQRAHDHLMMARTRLLATRQLDLAQIVETEAHRLLKTRALSHAGRKQIAFGTRGLVVGSQPFIGT